MLTPRTVFDLHRIVDTESSRYALSAVRFERDPATGDPRAIACDGRRLAVLSWAEPNPADCPNEKQGATLADGESLMLPAAACRDAAKFKVKTSTLKAKPFTAYTAIHEDHPSDFAEESPVTIAATDGETTAIATAKQLTGRYPHWRDIFKPATVQTHVSATLDARMLCELVDVIAKHVQPADGRPATVTISLDAVEPSNCGVLISARDIEAGRSGAAVLMPLYPDGKHAGGNICPRWQPVVHDEAAENLADSQAIKALAKRYGERAGYAAANLNELADQHTETILQQGEEIKALKAALAESQAAVEHNRQVANQWQKRHNEQAEIAACMTDERNAANRRIAELEAELSAARAVAESKAVTKERRETAATTTAATTTAMPVNRDATPRAIAAVTGREIEPTPPRPTEDEQAEIARRIILAVNC